MKTTEEFIAKIESFVTDSRCRIHLFNLIRHEVESIRTVLVNEYLGGDVSAAIVKERTEKYNAMTARLLAAFVSGCYWGDTHCHATWTYAIERLSSLGATAPGAKKELTDLRLLPALTLMFGGGIASIAAKKYDTLKAVTMSPKVVHAQSISPAVYGLQQYWKNKGGVSVTLSIMTQVSGASLGTIFATQISLEESFEEFVYFANLLLLKLNPSRDRALLPLQGLSEGNGDLMARVVNDAYMRKAEWEPMKAGLFGSIAEYKDLHCELQGIISETSH